MKNKIIKIISISVLSIFFFFPKQEISGTVKLVGTAIFPRLVITDDEKNYYFDKKFFEEYKNYVGKTITIKARVKKETLWLADRSFSFDEYIIIWIENK